MNFRQRLLIWKASVLLLLLTLAACASNSPQQPPVVVPGLKLDPLPASVTGIGLKPSENWQVKVQNYLSRLKDFSTDETPK